MSKEKGQTLAPPLPDGGQRKTKSASPAPAKKLIASRDSILASITIRNTPLPTLELISYTFSA